MKQLNLKPLVAMCLSNSRHVRESNAIEVVRHLGKFFETEFGNEAAAQLGHLEETLSLSQDKETQLQVLFFLFLFNLIYLFFLILFIFFYSLFIFIYLFIF